MVEAITLANRRLEDALGVELLIELEDDHLVVSGPVERVEDHDAALEIVREAAPGYLIQDNITVDTVMPGEVAGYEIADAKQGMFPGSEAGLESGEALEPGDFTDVETLQHADNATGPTASLEDHVSEGDDVYVPPVDPVGTDTEVIGGLQTSSMQSIDVDRSALDGRYGDEALRDAILRELREDSATSALQISVNVYRGVARLRGIVPDLVDAENAEEVAARVPGLLEVIDEIEVEGM